MNLLVNAALRGRLPGTVGLRTAADRIVVVTVHDAWRRAQRGELPYAADRFQRSDTARSRPGAGLGLSFVMTIFNHAEGKLRLCADGHHHRYQQRFDTSRSHPDEGATATVLLPAA